MKNACSDYLKLSNSSIKIYLDTKCLRLFKKNSLSFFKINGEKILKSYKPIINMGRLACHIKWMTNTIPFDHERTAR